MSTVETVIHAAQRLLQAGQPYALVSVIRAQAPASARPGDKAVVTADGTLHGWVGGGCAQPAVLRTVRQALADGQARLIRITPAAQGEEKTLGDVLEFGMSCHSGGTLELFVDPVLPRPQLVVVGASPVARSLARLAPQVGFEVTLVAHGEAGAAVEADRPVMAGDASPAVRHIDRDGLDAVQPHVGPGAWVVVATQGRRDVQGLRLALALQPRQVSFVASARKAQVLKDALLAAGADAAAVAAIVAPAGHPIAAETPEEIALSVLAALVAARRQGQAVAPVAVEAPIAVPTTAPSAAQTAAEPITASCCGGSLAAVTEAVTAAVAPAAVSAAVPSCCGGSVGDLPPLPAVKPRAIPKTIPDPVAPAAGGSCCGG